MSIAAQGRTEFALTSVAPASADACCGGDACACGAGGSADAAVATPVQLRADETGVVAEYGVAGLTCENCVRHVSDELSALDGVQTVDVRLVAGGVSTVRVKSDEPLGSAEVAKAVAEAGYALV